MNPRRKLYKNGIITAAIFLPLFIISGYGEGGSPGAVKPNHFQKEESNINVDEIRNPDDGSYQEIADEVRQLTFLDPHPKEDIIKELFLTPNKREHVSIQEEVKILGLFNK